MAVWKLHTITVRRRPDCCNSAFDPLSAPTHPRCYLLGPTSIRPFLDRSWVGCSRNVSSTPVFVSLVAGGFIRFFGSFALSFGGLVLSSLITAIRLVSELRVFPWLDVVVEHHGSKIHEEDEEENPFHEESDSSNGNATFQHHGREDYGVKVDIPDFEGHLNPEHFIDWLATVECVFDYKSIPEDKKVKLVAIRLKKHASIWWGNLTRRRAREGKRRITTWEKMKIELKKKFLPTSYVQNIFCRIYDFKQDELSVEEYTAAFEQLLMKGDVVESEEQTIARYLGGLRSEIRNIVQLQPYWTFEDVVKLAIRVEKQLKAKGARKIVGKEEVLNRGSASWSKPMPTDKATSSKSVPRKSNTPPSTSNTTSRQCFKCRGFGHISFECPNQKIVSLVEEDDGESIYDSYPSEENEVDHEEITYGDQGEVLVVQSILRVEHVEGDKWICHNIFHTQCTSHGKVCRVIIDSGTCENVVSTTMVEKLQLTVEKHPEPYKLSWLKKGNDIRIDKRCLVQFSIGRHYKDELFYDGFKNAYSFVNDGVKITLGPCKMENKSKSLNGEGSSLLSKSQFLRIMDCSTDAFALVLLEENEDREYITSSLKPLLKEFQDVVPDEIPPRLPPMREIQHNIGFVPDASIPNKAVYRMSPKEHEELQRQVDELLQKGLIRESLSPCAVLALLINFMVRQCSPRWTFEVDIIKYECASEMNGRRLSRQGMVSTNGWLMPFGFSNAPSTFLRLMNHVLKAFIGKFSVVYFDDILVYSKNLKEHFEHLRQVFKVLQEQRLYVNLKSTLVAPIIECLKGNMFKWDEAAQRSFKLIEKKITEAPVLALPNFEKVFKVCCDASSIGIGAVLSQECQLVAYFSEKLNGSQRNYSTYEKEFYAIARTLTNWRHYLISKESILFSDHEALKYINGQHKLNNRHAKWVEFLQAYTFVIKYKSGAQNQVADVLSRRHVLLSSMQVKVMGFEVVMEFYEKDPDFSKIWIECSKSTPKDFFLQDGFLFKNNCLCIPWCSLWEAIVNEAHDGGLGGYFGRDKTLALIKENFYWPNMIRDVSRYVERCRTCHIAKGHVHFSFQMHHRKM
ncbi:hypothetical protein CRG98_042530 [Punica granatum]|uniref:CCHC-type domain-containing protein n=1 Tax=Punica granatum TaxID=22663 RepID=A0A2I0I0U2_PUNGR|nr:hypothetical protein CRG98_042530 [Punica granatum]